MQKPILTATLVAGTLDIMAAIILTLYYGGKVPDMLRYVASGPFPGAPQWGMGGALLGLVVHFTLMAIMAAAFLLAAKQWQQLTTSPLLWGAVYGLVTYAIMNLLVVPLRFGKGWPPSTASLVTQLFCHVVLVGIPIAMIVARALRSRV